MAKLSVNLNKVATLRNTRSVGVPSVERCASICIDAGARGITLHPRPDERHIRPADVLAIAEIVANHPDVELNIEGHPMLGVV
ncbi:MAG: pyridoxine 5'-phosphate synthase, partial [Polyangiaceae bacterium]